MNYSYLAKLAETAGHPRLVIVTEPDLRFNDIKALAQKYPNYPKMVAVGMQGINNKLTLMMASAKDVTDFSAKAIFNDLKEKFGLRGADNINGAQRRGQLFTNWEEEIIKIVQSHLKSDLSFKLKRSAIIEI